MLNNWIGTGRITRDLEVKNRSGTDILNFSIAVERPFKNKQGERETDFIDIVAFNRTAVNITQYFKKGDGIGIVGRIQTRSYENNEGRKIYVTEVIAESFDFQIQNKDSNNNQQKSNYNPQSNQGQRDNTKKKENPFANVDFESEDPFANNEEVTDISDDDLPF